MAKKVKKLPKKPLPKVETGEVESEKIKKTRIRVIGIGGGGGNIVSELAQRVGRPSFLAANTDLKALKGVSRKVERFPFGKNFTHGLGTGMNPELGELAAQNEKERIKKILQGQDLVILIASLGGGAGSGAGPVFAQISKNLGNLTYGIFTLPFKFEGEKKMEIARNTLEKIRPKINALTVIPNEKIFQIVDKNTPLNQALSAINKNLAESLEGLIETIYEPGLINIDFADLKTILEGRGRLCYLNTLSSLKKEDKAREVIEKTLNSPLYPYSVRGAKAILYNIAGPKGLDLERVKEVSKAISEKVSPEAKIIFGVSENKKYGENIKITVLATGLSMKNFLTGPKPIKKPIKKKPPVKVKKEISLPKIEVKKPRKKKKRKAKKIKAAKNPAPAVKPQATAEAQKEKPPVLKKEQVRKNGLQLKKETEEAEKEMLEKEKFWETPAFLRKGLSK